MAQTPTRDATQRAVIDRLLDRYGWTYASSAGFTVQDAPAPLFRLLCLSLLLSARIRGEAAVGAARALSDAGWTTVDEMRASSWEERVAVLNRSGYARYDESTARMLGDTVDLLHDRYDGDLRRLRESAERRPSVERRLLREVKGVGNVGVSIFFREVQGVWDELRPFVDDRAARSAERLGLPGDAQALAALVDEEDLVRLVAALVRVELAKAHDEITS